MESKVLVTPLDTTVNSPIDCDQHGRYMQSNLPTGDGGEIELIHNPKLVKTENSREALESEEEHLQAKDSEDCLQTNYNRDYFKCKESECDSSSQDNKEGVQHWTVTSSCILPCSNNEHDQQNDMLSKQSANSGPVTHLDTSVCVDTAPVNTLSYIAGAVSTLNEEESVMSTPPAPIVIQPEPHEVIYQEVDKRNDPSERSGRNNTETTSSINSQLQDCETSVVNNEGCVSLQQQLNMIPFKCTVCGRGFTHANHLKVHHQIHLGEGTFTCNVCAKVFTSKLDLTTHLPTHTSQKCPVCGNYFTTSKGFQRHYMTYHSESFSCPVCPEVLPSKAEQIRHLRTHPEHECNVCGKRFTQLHNLTAHMCTHTGEKPYKCTVCGKGFTRSSNLYAHQYTHGKEKPLSCDVCGKGYIHKHRRDNHQRTHTEESPGHCSVCRKWFATSSILRNHQVTHRGDGPFTCNVCSKVFTTRLELTTHLPSHTPHQCSDCGKGFANLDQLTEHMSTHRVEMPVSGKRYAGSSTLKQHLQTRIVRKPFKCAVCGKDFAHFAQFAEHLRTHTVENLVPLSTQNEEESVMSTTPAPIMVKPEPLEVIYQVVDERNDPPEITGRNNTETTSSMNSQLQDCETSVVNNERCVSVQQQIDTIPFKCTVCDKGFTHANHLKLHHQIHTGEETYHSVSFSCPVSPKELPSKVELRRHLRSHPEHECKVCGKRFYQLHNLTHHMQTHTVKKPYKCNVCGNWFVSSSGLRTHHQRAHRERPYKCTVCGKGFDHSVTLTEHQHTHSAEKKFKCDMCGKEFKHRHSLTNHRRAHREKPHKCTVCGKEFAQSAHLTTHQLSHSAEKSFKCDLCGKEFIQRNDFINHHWTHFITVSSLTAHQQTHSEKGPEESDGQFTCTVCSKVFTSRLELTTHLPSHTPHECSVCGERFSQVPNLLLHMLTHGGETD